MFWGSGSHQVSTLSAHLLYTSQPGTCLPHVVCNTYIPLLTHYTLSGRWGRWTMISCMLADLWQKDDRRWIHTSIPQKRVLPSPHLPPPKPPPPASLPCPPSSECQGAMSFMCIAEGPVPWIELPMLSRACLHMCCPCLYGVWDKPSRCHALGETDKVYQLGLFRCICHIANGPISFRPDIYTVYEFGISAMVLSLVSPSPHPGRCSIMDQHCFIVRYLSFGADHKWFTCPFNDLGHHQPHIHPSIPRETLRPGNYYHGQL